MQVKFKDPSLKLRYAQGLGDVVACILHSKLIGWLTKWITGKDKPCQLCSVRRQALNTLCSVPVWKIFFKDLEEAARFYVEEYTLAGHSAEYVPFENGKGFQIRSAQIEPQPNTSDNQKPDISNSNSVAADYNSALIDSKLEDYILTSISENEQDHILIRVHIYKKK